MCIQNGETSKLDPLGRRKIREAINWAPSGTCCQATEYGSPRQGHAFHLMLHGPSDDSFIRIRSWIDPSTPPLQLNIAPRKPARSTRRRTQEAEVAARLQGIKPSLHPFWRSPERLRSESARRAVRETHWDGDPSLRMDVVILGHRPWTRTPAWEIEPPLLDHTLLPWCGRQISTDLKISNPTKPRETPNWTTGKVLVVVWVQHIETQTKPPSTYTSTLHLSLFHLPRKAVSISTSTTPGPPTPWSTRSRLTISSLSPRACRREDQGEIGWVRVKKSVQSGSVDS